MCVYIYVYMCVRVSESECVCVCVSVCVQVWSKLIENLADIGYDPSTMHMAAYDWRYI